MVILNADNGKILATLPIGKCVDGAVFNPNTNLSGESLLPTIYRAFPTLPARSSLRVLRRMLVMPTHELMHGERDLVGMQCAPSNNALQLDGIVRDGADFHQLGFDDLQVSHRSLSMAHFCTGKL
jgi:hypothetical protein